MISEVLLISKPRADKSWSFGISWCFRFLLLGVLEEFKNSFVAENLNSLVNMSKQSWLVTDALRLCRIGTHGLVINQAQTARREKGGTFPVVFAMGRERNRHDL